MRPRPPVARMTALARMGLELSRHHVHGHDAAAHAVVDDEGGAEPLLVRVDTPLLELLPDDVQDGLAGDVGDVARPGEAGPSEGAGGEATVLAAAEGGAHALQLDDVGRRLLAEDLDSVLVRQVVAALDGIEGVLLPGVVLAHRSIDAPLGRRGVAAERLHLGEQSHVDSLVGGLQGGPHAGQAGPHHQNIVARHHHKPF